MRQFFSICLSVVVVVVVFVFPSCRDQQLTSDPSARLRFSVDSINFDTVFTAQGSSTRILTIYNPNPNAVRISRVWWKKGEKFFANLDGENKITNWHDIDLYGGDSLYLFICTEIDPYGPNQHLIETDTLVFEVNGHTQSIAVQAYGLDVERIFGPKHISSDYHLTNDKPYLIYDTLQVDGTLTIDAGTTCYMHTNARILAHGDVVALGTATSPIRFQGDRTDYLFPKVPYRVASGQWGGIFLIDTLGGRTYRMEHIHLLSGQVGLYASAPKDKLLPHLKIHNARVHNMSSCGIVLENIHAELSNVELSNCASYGLYLAGGDHRVEHISVANYFGYPYTTLNIHGTQRQNVAAVYLLASSNETAAGHDTLYNCIITGAVRPALVVDSLPEQVYPSILGCYLLCDSLPGEWGSNNTYAQNSDTVFNNTYYRYQEYIYYDFHLSARSPARAIGVPLSGLRLDVANDLDNRARQATQPDAGCYCNPVE